MKTLVILSAAIAVVLAQSGPPFCRLTKLGVEYRGDVAKTVSGKTCQNWAAQSPHKHTRFHMLAADDSARQANYCRNPDNTAGGPWCYTTDPNKRWEYCHISYCSAPGNCKHDTKGAGYRGTLSKTENGRTCQPWASQSPHKHTRYNMLAANDPARQSNFCRNPDNSSDGPWCYTEDPDVRWEYCDVKLCSEVGCKASEKGSLYRGEQSVTLSGRECQDWAAQSPHKQTRGKMLAPNDPAKNSNFCRNPDNTALGPWCYTVDDNKRWEYCDVRFCKNQQECKTTVKGAEYRGHVAVTKEGKTCQNWDKQTPHKHTRFNMLAPGDAARQTNYCRNPDNSAGGPWCYTTDPNTRWQYCDVQLCSVVGCKMTYKGEEYRGHVAKTRSGKTCQKWDVQTPHKHTRLHMLASDDSARQANYCRNPDNSAGGPWCYTTDPNTRWDYCDVRYC